MKRKKMRAFIVIELYNKGASTGIIPAFTFNTRESKNTDPKNGLLKLVLPVTGHCFFLRCQAGNPGAPKPVLKRIMDEDTGIGGVLPETLSLS